MIEKLLAALAGLATLFALFWRQKAKRASAYKRATEILKKDAEIDQDITEKKAEVDTYETAEELEDGFRKLREYK